MHAVYLDRADQMSRARDLIRNDSAFTAATALLAVHTAISLNDALLVRLKGSRGKNDDHLVAAREIEKLCRARRLDITGVKHLRMLLSAKSNISYGEDRTTQDFADTLATAGERFQNWAYKIFKELA